MSGGFVMVPTWLLAKDIEGHKLSPAGLSAYVNLATYGTMNILTGEYEECRPSMKTLAKDMDVALNTARRAVHELQRFGGILGSERFDERGHQLPTVYRVVFGAVCEPLSTPPPPKNDRGGTPKSGRGPLPNPTGGPLPNLVDNQEPLNQEPTPREKTTRAKRASTPPAALAAIADDHFAEWYDAYPLKKDRPKARAAYIKALEKLTKDERVIEGRTTPVDLLLCAAHAYRNAPDRDPGYTKHPTTWLNNEAWDNERTPQPRATVAGGLVERNGMKVTAKTAAGMDLVAELREKESRSVTTNPDAWLLDARPAPRALEGAPW